MEMHAFGRLTPVEVARSRLLRSVRPVERIERIAVDGAFGRVAATTVHAPIPIPTFARTTWDGYALRSDDTRSARRGAPRELRVVGEVFAEGAFGRRIRAGETVAIATGGAVPAGADAVVIFEEVERTGSSIRVPRPIAQGDRISPPGHDFPKGAVLARRGEKLTAVALGAIAACGLPSVDVYAQPIIAILPNGNELLSPGDPPSKGRIYESNNASLAAVVQAEGGIARPMPPLPDDPRRIRAALRKAVSGSDLVLATGGSSVGERDHLPRLLPELGPLLFHGIAVRAGKPTLAARSGRKLVIGMPGHPTSCLVNMYWLILPVLRKLGHLGGPGWTEGTAVLGSDAVAATPGLATVVPLEFRDGRAYSTFRGSSVITSLEGATAFAMLRPGQRIVRAGERIRVFHLDPPLGDGGVASSARNR